MPSGASTSGPTGPFLPPLMHTLSEVQSLTFNTAVSRTLSPRVPSSLTARRMREGRSWSHIQRSCWLWEREWTIVPVMLDVRSMARRSGSNVPSKHDPSMPSQVPVRRRLSKSYEIDLSAGTSSEGSEEASALNLRNRKTAEARLFCSSSKLKSWRELPLE